MGKCSTNTKGFAQAMGKCRANVDHFGKAMGKCRAKARVLLRQLENAE
jgi:hypothetical protein